MSVAPALDVAAVTAPSRERLLRALAAAIKQRGYRETTVADIVAHARTSRRTFYEVFATKDDCFLALLHEMNQLVQGQIVAAVDPAAPWDEQVRRGVGAWVDAIASEPEVGMSWIRELPSLGARGIDAHRHAMRSYTTLLIGLSGTPEMREAGVAPISESRALILLGGLRELAVGAIERGEQLGTIRAEAIDAALALLAPTAPAAPGRRHRSRFREVR